MNNSSYIINYLWEVNNNINKKSIHSKLIIQEIKEIFLKKQILFKKIEDMKDNYKKNLKNNKKLKKLKEKWNKILKTLKDHIKLRKESSSMK